MTPAPSPHDTYTSPLASRNASPEMLRIWSPRHKFNTWRRIWLAVAEAQQACGLSITDEQIAELRAVVERGITDEEMARAAELERELRHDVMAHVHCLGEQCPKAKPIIHLGCTSQDVVCNADFQILYDAHRAIELKLAAAISRLADFAVSWAATPTLGYTHYQTAQPLTVGRRAAGWAYELSLNIHPLYAAGMVMRPKGLRGATGTAAAFMALLNSEPAPGKYASASREELKRMSWFLPDEKIEAGVSMDLGWDVWTEWNCYEDRDPAWSRPCHILTGQTYPRVCDVHMLNSLGAVAAVLHKIATDIRLLSNRKEIDEPFGKNQIGSSAMPYKRNPMKCERICGLSRFVMNMVGNAYDTAATQWLERTLDDSSNRRLSLPESFLALDGALDLMHEVASGLVVNEAMVRKNLMDELPFLATENILMEAVKAGGDRQDLHEAIRVHAQAAGQRVKQEGLDNDLLDRVKNDPMFQSKAKGGHLDRDLNWDNLMDPMQYVGRSVEQTERFVKEVVEPLRERYADELAALGSSDRGV